MYYQALLFLFVCLATISLLSYPATKQNNLVKDNEKEVSNEIAN